MLLLCAALFAGRISETASEGFGYGCEREQSVL
jgi:hypothetical protein